MPTIADRYKKFREQLPENVELVAVSKTHSPRRIMELYELGHRAFGENRVQELLPKYEELPKDIEWHIIGHLQRNKVKFIAPFVHLIHSVDSERLLSTIDREAERCERVIDCLVQVHIAEEKSKYGFTEEEARTLFSGDVATRFPHARIVGLMGMATFTDNRIQVAEEFLSLQALFEEVRESGWVDKAVFQQLSMGMSGDWDLAVKAGSTIVRVGSTIFGSREG